MYYRELSTSKINLRQISSNYFDILFIEPKIQSFVFFQIFMKFLRILYLIFFLLIYRSENLEQLIHAIECNNSVVSYFLNATISSKTSSFMVFSFMYVSRMLGGFRILFITPICLYLKLLHILDINK